MTEVVESATTFAWSPSSTSHSRTLATLPGVGELVYLLSMSDGNTGTFGTPTGLGATWSLVKSQVFVANARYQLWVGTGATSAGDVSWTFSVARGAFAGLFLVRGVNDPQPTYLTETTWFIADGAGPGEVRELSAHAGPGTFMLGVFEPNASGAGRQLPSDGTTAGWNYITYSQGNQYFDVGFQVFAASPGAPAVIGVESLVTGAYLPGSLMVFGGPDGTRAEGVKVEALTVGTPALEVASAYTEAVTRSTAAMATDLAYTELLSRVQNATLIPSAYVEVLSIVPVLQRRNTGWGLPILA